MVNLNYYGNTPGGSVTFLEFGSINFAKSKKEVYDIRKDQQAYDWYMLGRYANDIYLYDTLINQAKQNTVATLMQDYLENIHHKHDFRFNVYKMLSFIASGNNQSFYELGQTLFGCIEGMQFVETIQSALQIKASHINLKLLEWYGVDISPFFNYLSQKFHPDFKVFVGETFDHLPKQIDVFFAKGVTMLYAVCQAQSILDLISRCRCGYFDYSFSMQGNQVTYIPTGKQVTYVDYNEFSQLVTKSDFMVYANMNTAKYNAETQRIYVECFYGTEADCFNFTNHLKIFEEKLFAALNHKQDTIKSLMDTEKPSHWLPLADCIQHLSS